ncbi:hypothetical protein NBO_742g0002 [Nosema bombycis CQ1]|uniref:Uncharacterized protein n=1 Tax=Nosema bombycis (strain CQ1 / CVCC 102059) TaxID=578461 RepID=R0MCT4_NOSB1|nr:hypothetical protein NBO_742g0002 [Nosema bombycis CQ1]|eukprot:EOB11840.1 hypothetical protein NBO_742g0002 [Nosema bombycis CQ1]
MENQDVTLASIKDILSKYSSKKSLFTDSSIINKIEESNTKIKESIYTNNKSLIKILKDCSEEIRLLKIQNNKIEANECVECLIILNKIKKDIEEIRKENSLIKNKIWWSKMMVMALVGVVIGVIVSKM